MKIVREFYLATVSRIPYTGSVRRYIARLLSDAITHNAYRFVSVKLKKKTKSGRNESIEKFSNSIVNGHRSSRESNKKKTSQPIIHIKVWATYMRCFDCLFFMSRSVNRFSLWEFLLHIKLIDRVYPNQLQVLIHLLEFRQNQGHSRIIILKTQFIHSFHSQCIQFLSRKVSRNQINPNR